LISPGLIDRFAEAIAEAEGFNKPGSVPQRANNPLDITDEGDIGHGVIRTGGPHGAPITIYATAADGWAAGKRKLRRMLSGASEVYPLSLTLDQVAYKYCGDPTWAVNVAQRLGVDPSTTLASLVEQDRQLQANA
jgi:hypothetical protein